MSYNTTFGAEIYLTSIVFHPTAKKNFKKTFQRYRRIQKLQFVMGKISTAKKERCIQK